MSEAAGTTPTIEQLGQLARDKAAYSRRQGDERACPICAGLIYHDRIVGHILQDHREHLIREIQAKGAATK